MKGQALTMLYLRIPEGDSLDPGSQGRQRLFQRAPLSSQSVVADWSIILGGVKFMQLPGKDGYHC